MRAEALKGHLDLLLLSVLEGVPAHGYLVIDRLREASDGAFDLAEGTVYPALHRLGRAGLLESRGDGEGRRRRIYELTARGHAALVTSRSEWRGFAAAQARGFGGGP